MYSYNRNYFLTSAASLRLEFPFKISIITFRGLKIALSQAYPVNITVNLLLGGAPDIRSI